MFSRWCIDFSGQQPRSTNHVFLPSIALTIAAALAFRAEQPTEALKHLVGLTSLDSGIIVLNAICATVAVRLGGSMLVFFNKEHDIQEPSLYLWRDIYAHSLSTGLIGAALVIRDYIIVSPFQVLAAFAVTLSLLTLPAGSPSSILKLARLPLSPDHTVACETHRYDMVDLEDDADPDAIISVHERLPSGAETRVSMSTLILGLLIATIWGILAVTSLQTTFLAPAPRSSASLDTTFQPLSGFDVVISMYDEPISELQHTIDLITSISSIALQKPRIHIYTKSEAANASVVRTLLPNPAGLTITTTQLLNIGREGQSYLHHILKNWDGLANHTLFMQAKTHMSRQLKMRASDYFVPSTGFLSLGEAEGAMCDCSSSTCSDRFWADNSGLVRETYLAVHGLSECPTRNSTSETVQDTTVALGPSGKILLSYKGQFIVSAKRIRGVRKQIYEDLNTLFVDENAWTHTERYLSRVENQDGLAITRSEGNDADHPHDTSVDVMSNVGLQNVRMKDDMSAPVFGYTMERMWSMVFQCDEESIARTCPSLLSGWRTGGRREDCQCLDY